MYQKSFISALLFVLIPALGIAQDDGKNLDTEKKKGSYSKEVEAELEFLEANAKKEGVVQLDSGLQYKVLTSGTGNSPVAIDMVKAHYEVQLITGELIDSSYTRGTPITLPVGRVIPGWSEALLLMKEGDKWELYVPNALAFGERGSPPRIPPFTTLTFKFELINILSDEERMQIQSHGHAH